MPKCASGGLWPAWVRDRRGIASLSDVEQGEVKYASQDWCVGRAGLDAAVRRSISQLWPMGGGASHEHDIITKLYETT